MEVVNPISNVAGKYGIEALKEAFGKVKELVDTGFVVMEDGKITIGDSKVVPELIADLRDLVAASKEAGPELKELDADEVKEAVSELVGLVAYVAGKFGLV